MYKNKKTIILYVLKMTILLALKHGEIKQKNLEHLRFY